LARLDPDAVAAVLARLIEIYWRAGQIQEAARLCARAHLLCPAAFDPKTGDPRLQFFCRKIASSVAPQSPPTTR